MGRNYGGGWMVGNDGLSAVPLGDQADFLDRMIDTLEQGGWTQQDHENEEGMCIEGAARKIMQDEKAFFIADWEKNPVTGDLTVPQMCFTGFAAEATLKRILGAELGMPPKLIRVAATSGRYNYVEEIEILGYDNNYNPIPVFNDTPGRTKTEIIAKLREVVEEIRAGQGVFDGDAPSGPQGEATASPVLWNDVPTHV